MQFKAETFKEFIIQEYIERWEQYYKENKGMVNMKFKKMITFRWNAKSDT